MRRWTPLAIAAALAGAACAHPRRATDERPRREKREAPDDPNAKGVPAAPGRPQAPASPEGLLTGGTVGRIQAALADRGYLARHRSGELDDATRAALRKFQADEGLAATGMPDRETLSRLGLSPEASYGRNEGPERGGTGGTTQPEDGARK